MKKLSKEELEAKAELRRAYLMRLRAMRRGVLVRKVLTGGCVWVGVN